MQPDLATLLRGGWAELSAAVVDRRHGFHIPALATVGLDATPQARAVVLRHADATTAELRCHTDRRSPKVAEIAANPSVAWLFYDASRKLQLRVEATARVEFEGALADAAWENSALSSRRCYLAPDAPGDVSDEFTANLPEHLRGRVPTKDESEAGRVNFAVVATTVHSIDLLFLESDGHQRARFTRGADGAWLSAWLAP
jgi:general stress protein 26